ncbi:hypothetical protein GCM10018780_12880 [Streptomyces lanatus]|nr:hypothetical protein GCM10018780_12880 [Streptomyces lanatus]
MQNFQRGEVVGDRHSSAPAPRSSPAALVGRYESPAVPGGRGRACVQLIVAAKMQVRLRLLTTADTTAYRPFTRSITRRLVAHLLLLWGP